MIKLNIKLAAAAALAAAVLAGCGGGSGVGVSLFGACTQNQMIAAVDVANYTEQVIAFDQNSQPIDISCRTLATDETLQPQPII